MADEPVVAPIQPLDVTGTRTMAVGTVIWAVAFLVLLGFDDRLADDGRTWWLWTCLAAVGGGVVGIAYCKRRERRLRDGGSSTESSPIGAAGL